MRNLVASSVTDKRVCLHLNYSIAFITEAKVLKETFKIVSRAQKSFPNTPTQNTISYKEGKRFNLNIPAI